MLAFCYLFLYFFVFQYLSGNIDKSVMSMNSSTIQGTFRSMGNVSQARLSLNRGQIFTTVAMYKGDVVAVKKSFKRKISIDRPFMLEMKNVIMFFVWLFAFYNMHHKNKNYIIQTQVT